MNHLFERTVTLDGKFQVGAVVAHHIYLCCRQLVAFHLVNPSFNRLYDFRTIKRIDMIPSFSVAAITGEEAAIMNAFKRTTEVIALRIERIARMFDVPSAVFTHFGDIDIQTAHSVSVSVAGEIEVAIGTEGGEFFIARRVDRCSDILDATIASSCDANAPDILAAFAARHVADEIQPVAIRREGRVGEIGQCVFGEFHLRGFSPCSIRAVAHGDGGIAGIRRVGDTLGDKHLTIVSRECWRTLVEFGIQACTDGFWLTPFPFVVLLAVEDVTRLGACDAAQFVTLCLVAGGSPIELVVLVAKEHRRIVGTARVEDFHLLHLVSGSVCLLLGCRLRRLQTCVGCS